MPSFGPTGGEVRLHYDGIGQVMKSRLMAGLMAEAANAVAAQLAGAGVETVWVDTYTTDRRAASVTIPDYKAEGMEAKYGLLSEAALAVGLEVKKK